MDTLSEVGETTPIVSSPFSPEPALLETFDRPTFFAFRAIGCKKSTTAVCTLWVYNGVHDILYAYNIISYHIYYVVEIFDVFMTL